MIYVGFARIRNAWVRREGFRVRYGNLKRIADAGVRVALGTDSYCGFGKFGENTIVEAERSAAAGIAPLGILKMATKDAAEHLGTGALGTIAPGKLADLILLKEIWPRT